MTMRAAIIGYGRFGAALGELLQEAGIGHRAYDPDGARVPAEVRAQSVAEVVRGARFVVLAVPVPRIADAVASVQPHLREDHIVTDVCSVKMLPTEVLRARLGDARPWVATHPLFGPTSLALGERPLRVVVCPNDLHPEAVAAVRDGGTPVTHTGRRPICAFCGKKDAPQRCSRCKSVCYCGRECQVGHWKAHKAGCKLAAADLKATGGAGGSH